MWDIPLQLKCQTAPSIHIRQETALPKGTMPAVLLFKSTGNPLRIGKNEMKSEIETEQQM